MQCREAARKYGSYLSDDSTFFDWTLEELVSILRLHSAAPRIGYFHDRYLAFDKVLQALDGAAPRKQSRLTASPL